MGSGEEVKAEVVGRGTLVVTSGPWGLEGEGSQLGEDGRCWAWREASAAALCPGIGCGRYEQAIPPFDSESHSAGGRRDHDFPRKRTKALPFRGTPGGLEWHFPQCVPLGANRC